MREGGGSPLRVEDAWRYGIPADAAMPLYELSTAEMRAYLFVRQYVRPSFDAAWPVILPEWK